MTQRRFLQNEEIQNLDGALICGCLERQNFSGLRQLRYIGNDDTNGRYADVTLEECTACGQLWLRYFFDYTRPRSGRWFRGLISDVSAEEITTENAAAYLENLDWYMGGGSHYDGKVYYIRGAIDDF